VHEYLLWRLCGDRPLLEHLTFFVLHGLAVTVVVILRSVWKRYSLVPLPHLLSTVLTSLWFLWVAPLFFNPFLRCGFFERTRLPLYGKWL